MTDLEYHVRLLIQALKTGDLNTIDLLCDMTNTTPLKLTPEDQQFLDNLNRHTDLNTYIHQLGIPPHLLNH